MTERDYLIEKRSLGDGWVEFRIVMLRNDRSPDFKWQGDDARLNIARHFFSGASGLADRLGYAAREVAREVARETRRLAQETKHQNEQLQAVRTQVEMLRSELARECSE